MESSRRQHRRRDREPEQLRGVGPRAAESLLSRGKAGCLLIKSISRTRTCGACPRRAGSRLNWSSPRRVSRTFPDYSADGTNRVRIEPLRELGDLDCRCRWFPLPAKSPHTQQRRRGIRGGRRTGELIAFDTRRRRKRGRLHDQVRKAARCDFLTSEPSSQETPSWSPRRALDSSSSSNRSGGFQIWKVATDQPAQPVQVTQGGGTDPRESADGSRVFYTKRKDSALEIWSTGVNGGAETRVLGPIRSRAGWVPDRHGIYFIEPARGIAYYRFATGDTTPLVALRNVSSSPFNPGLALSPDGRWLLYTQMDRAGADVMLVENFR